MWKSPRAQHHLLAVAIVGQCCFSSLCCNWCRCYVCLSVHGSSLCSSTLRICSKNVLNFRWHAQHATFSILIDALVRINGINLWLWISFLWFHSCLVCLAIQCGYCLWKWTDVLCTKYIYSYMFDICVHVHLMLFPLDLHTQTIDWMGSLWNGETTASMHAIQSSKGVSPWPKMESNLQEIENST